MDERTPIIILVFCVQSAAVGCLTDAIKLEIKQYLHWRLIQLKFSTLLLLLKLLEFRFGAFI